MLEYLFQIFTLMHTENNNPINTQNTYYNVSDPFLLRLDNCRMVTSFPSVRFPNCNYYPLLATWKPVANWQLLS